MTIPLSLRFEILSRDRFTCQFCGKPAPETELEVDHKHPRSKGGSDKPDNLVTSCRNCNRGKSDRVINGTPPAGVSPDRAPAKKKLPGLAGLFFHNYDGENGTGYIKNQGRIVEEMPDGFCRIQCFEWITGAPSLTGGRIVPTASILEDRWTLYETDEEMRQAYEYGSRQHPGLRALAV